ncbi:polysaccharide biosynthesis/export family protein [Fundidesulfovibrio terrae]|uniref:polysaccharide biosynthesis/export family protein n=1 Tax=Fundidesulfovibrio terrae TaxID=2922866 RepID=UPI001FB00EF0|nr:polysaccharide biosynthesis/export family protein [Fundidesulfovibrio terrae]
MNAVTHAATRTAPRDMPMSGQCPAAMDPINGSHHSGGMTTVRMILAFVLLAVLIGATTTRAADYGIVVGDKLAIMVQGEADLSIGATVRPDGKITYPNIGEVQAAGLTPTQLSDKLAAGLKHIVRKPIVSVTVVEGKNDKVYVVGGGVKHTFFELSTHKDLLQLLASIDDMTVADLDQASLVRENKVVLKGFRQLYEDGDISLNQELHAGDVIILPVLKDRFVYVSGAVNKPRTLSFREGMTVLDAIMEAEGFSKFASPNGTKIVRRAGEKEEVIKVKAKRLMDKGDSSQNYLLQRGDMVIVEEGMF